MSQPDMIRAYLSEAGARVICFKINREAKVSSIRKLVPYKDVVFIAKGLILAQNLSFRENGIEDGDRVVYLPNDSWSNAKKTFWIGATSQNTESFERRRLATTVEGKRELARLMDLSMYKAESRLLFRNVEVKFNNYFRTNETIPIRTITNYPPFTKPETSPLPCPFIDERIDSNSPSMGLL